MEFPDSDEEYDLVETVAVKTPEKLPADNNVQKEKVNETPNQKLSVPVTKSIDAPPSTQLEFHDAEGANSVETVRKRTYDELINAFGDIFDDGIIADVPIGRDKRPRWDEPEAVIDLILKERKKQHVKDDGTVTQATSSGIESYKDSISTRVPTWNFIALTRPSDSQRIYLRVRDKKNEFSTNPERRITGLLAVPYSEMKAEAEEIMLRNVKRASLPEPKASSENSNDQLWVDKYRPQSYMELLSDETVNRSFLGWLKLWDKVVFHREPAKRKKRAPTQTFGSSYGSKNPDKKFFGQNKFFRKDEAETVDAKGFPVHRIALLSGPPGLGKTTLAHLVAKHAGYNVVEVNASDDRGPDAFRQALLASTEMRSLMGSDPRPNCLVLDEVDGAPAASIDLLIKFVQGKLVTKGKKKKAAEGGGKNSEGCKRPVICICNEAYTPSLRALRAMAFIVPVPKVSPARLADRLATIARKEHLKADLDALLQLAERSGCDIRSCLCALQYMGEACIDSNYHLGLKDVKRGLFDCWKDILQIPMTRGGHLSIRERVQVVLKAAHSGETERLAQGIFHNYPETAPRNWDVVASTLEWFQLYDKITTVVMTRQDWRVMPYTNYAFVAWHFGFASAHPVKLSYPYTPAEVNQKLNKSRAMLAATKRAYGRDAETLTLDVAPFLSELLNPKLRSVSGHLYSTKERADLVRLLNVLLDLGLAFVQMKNEDGAYDYVLDPNLFEIGIFPDCKVRRVMPYAVKQIVAQELELERLRRAAIAMGAVQEKSATEAGETAKKIAPEVAKKIESAPTTPTVPNHLRQLEPMPLQPKTKNKYRDYFENFVPLPTAPTGKQKSPGTSPRAAKSIHRVRQILKKFGVWYKYKEGFSNSVRRDVKMSELL